MISKRSPVMGAGFLFVDAQSSSTPAYLHVGGRRVVVAVFRLLSIRSINKVHDDEQHDHRDHKTEHELLGTRVRRITHPIADSVGRFAFSVPNLFVSRRLRGV